MPNPSRRSLLAAASVSGLAAAAGARPFPSLLRKRTVDDGLQIAIVGAGYRGVDHLEALGYPNLEAGTESFHEKIANVELVAVCDTYDGNRERARAMVAAKGYDPRPYVDFREMLEKEDLDAIVVATPDFTHSLIVREAARAGVDAYVEKCMTNSIDEVFELERVLEETGRIVQVGYQMRQDEIHRVAREYVERGYIGDVHVVQAVLRRNGENAGWKRAETAHGGPPREQVHWDEFLAGEAPAVDYDPERYFEWRRFWDYGTGICGDLLSHSIDEMEIILGVGMPDRAVSSGGIYHWKDGRETPDTYSTVLEYPDRDLSFTYNCTMSNSHPKQAMTLLGTEGTIEVSWKLDVYPDLFSTKYEKQLRNGKIKHTQPMISIKDKAAARQLAAEPSQLWLAGRGATMTTRGGGEYDTTRLHWENFVDCVRSREEPAGSFRSSFSSTIASHMSTLAYRERREVRWDAEKRKVV